MALRFGECELDPERYELRRRGEVVHVEPKVFDVLDYLMRQRERVVTKRELLDALWPGEVVSDSVLSRAIAAVRRAVGDDRRGQHVIQTVHGRGYRFVAEIGETAQSEPSAPDLPPAPRPPADFVGREAVLAQLEEALAAAVGGSGRIVLLAGEPGIGKTSTAEQLIGLGDKSGARTLLGQCREGEGAPAFWPWIQILRGCCDALDDSALRAALGVGAQEIGGLLPELRERLPDLPEPTPVAGDETVQAQQIRFRFFDSLASFFRNLARRTPLVLVLDDVHWADPASVLLVEFLSSAIRNEPIFLLATYRDTEVRGGSTLSDVLGALATDGSCSRLSLRGLSEHEIGRVIENLTGREPEPEILAAVAELTEGNPFFVREIAQQRSEAPERGAAEAKGRLTLALPQSVRDAIGRRLRGLSVESREALAAASVLGREFRVPLLAAMLGCAPQEVLDRLEEATAAQVVLASEERPGDFAFRHALIRQTLYEAQSLPQRVSLHRRAGEATERMAGHGVDDHLPELAHHFFEAAPGGDTDRAVDYAERAAVRAHELLSYEESARQYTRALEALDLDLEPDDERRLDLMLSLGQELNTAGRTEEAQPLLIAAASLARRLERPDLLAQAAVGLWTYGIYGSAPSAEHLALLEEARATLGEDQTLLRSRVLSRLSGAEPYRRSMEGRAALANDAYELASAQDDPAALGQALSARWYASLGPDQIEERFRVADEQAALAERSGNLRVALEGLETRLGAELITGRFESADATIERYDAIAQTLRQPFFFHQVELFRTAQAVNFGRYAEAESRLSGLREMGRGMIPYNNVLWGGMIWWLISQRGDDQAYDPEYFAGLGGSLLSPDHPLVYGGMGVAFMTLGEDAQARRAFDQALEITGQTTSRDEHWLYQLALLSDLAAHFQDAVAARAVYDQLLPYADLFIVHDLLRGVAGSVLSPLGDTAGIFGDLEQAEVLLAQAFEREQAAGLRRALASTLASQAALAVRRGNPGDERLSESLIAECIEICESIGAPGQGDQYLRRLERVRGRSSD